MRRTSLAWVSISLATASVLCTLPARAHDRTASYSTWHLSDASTRVTLTLAEAEVGASLPSGSDALGGYATSRLVLASAGEPCTVRRRPRTLSAPPGYVMIEWTVGCAQRGDLEVRSSLLLDEYPGHLHFVTLDDGHARRQHVLSKREPAWRAPRAPSTAPVPLSATIVEYWAFGLEHIATGYDHLVFLLALLLYGGTLMSLVMVVSGFTVGHTITLAIASLGLVEANMPPIEAMIGLSIVLVAIENVWLLGSRTWVMPVAVVGLLLGLAGCAQVGLGRLPALSCLGIAILMACYYPLLRDRAVEQSARWTMALIFGMLHGLGFASVLRSADLPPDRLLLTLASFSVGVETGQLVLVALAWPLLRWAMSRSKALVVEIGSAAALGCGAYWLVVRAYV